MLKNKLLVPAILLGSTIFGLTHHVSKSDAAGAKKVPYKPNAPGLNIHWWAYDPYKNVFEYRSPDQTVVKTILVDYASDKDKQFLDTLVAVEYDHQAIIGSIFMTGCLSWSKNAYKKADDWNKKHPHALIVLEEASK